MWHVVFPRADWLGSNPGRLGLVEWRLPNRGEIYEHQMTVCTPPLTGEVGVTAGQLHMQIG